MIAVCVTEVAFPFNLHLFRVILQSLLTGDVIAVFSTSFSISPACPLLFDSNSSVDWLTTHQDPFTPAHTTSKLPVLHQHQSPSPACSQPSVMLRCFELQFSLPAATTPNGLYTLDQPHSSNLIRPTPSPQLHLGLHDNTLWREVLIARAAKTVSICSIKTVL